MIELKDVSIGYGSDMLVEGCDALFPPASLTALVGRNGSGKSTLLRAIAGLCPVASGEIIIDGRSRFDSAAQRARSIAFVNTQRVRIANMRCRDLVALGRAPYTDWSGHIGSTDRAIVSQALATVGMADFAGRCLDSMSDGECQRIMIARALAQDTPNILLDEPTSFLDIPNRHQLIALLQQLAHDNNKTITLSTHELDIALAYADHIALIHNRRLTLLDAHLSSTRTTVYTAFGI